MARGARKKDQYTMLETDLSIAVDNVIAFEDELDAVRTDRDKALGELAEAMQKHGKPEIKHSKGYEFRLEHKLPSTKVRVKRPKDIKI